MTPSTTLSDAVNRALAGTRPEQQELRRLLQAVAAVSEQTAEHVAPTVNALGRYAIDEIRVADPMSKHVSEILGVHQAMVRAARRAQK